MNPGKIVDPYPITESLRLQALASGSFAPQAAAFSYREDKGSFPRALLRCVGMGKCRRPSGGTMCPSYMVTREEEHSTRGRARLLLEMFTGETITAGWKSEEVYEALDLCLACKGCKSDCPVGVDMATYKAEFLSHYWKGKIRPRSAYAFGLIAWWARAASLAPRLVNFFTQTPGFSAVARAAASVAPQRKIPAFAPQTFRTWFESRVPSPDHPSFSFPTPSIISCGPTRRLPPSKCSRPRDFASGFRAPSSVAGGRSTTTGCSVSRGGS